MFGKKLLISGYKSSHVDFILLLHKILQPENRTVIVRKQNCYLSTRFISNEFISSFIHAFFSFCFSFWT